MPSALRLERLLDHLPACIAYVDGEQRYRYNNRASANWFGIAPEQCQGKHVSEVIGVAAYALAKPNLERALGGEELSFTKRYATMGGGERLIRAFYRPDFDDQGAVQGIFVMVIEVAEEQNALEALQDSQQQYQQLVEEMNAAIILFEAIPAKKKGSLDFRHLQVNKAFTRQTGLSPQQVLGKTLREVFPAIEAHWLSVMERVCDSGAAEELEEFFSSLGRYYQVSFFRPRVGFLACSFFDITERKLAEELSRATNKELSHQISQISTSFETVRKQLHREISRRNSLEQQMQLSDSIYAHSIEGICIMDREGVILQVNPAFTAITGYGANEVIGKTPSILKSGQHDQTFYHEMWRQLLASGHWSGELLNRRKDGEIYPELLNITAIYTANGEVAQFVSIFHDLSELKASKEELVRQKLHDALTGLPNRLLFIDHCDTLLIHAEVHQEALVVALIDLDDFKDLNESLGYVAGDNLLRETGIRIGSCCRPQDMVARMGGDEFALLLPDLRDSIDDGLVMMTRVLEKLAKPFSVNGADVFLKASIGLASFPDHGHDAETLLRKAELALYQAKSLGKSRVKIYTSQVDAQFQRRVWVLSNLRRALEMNEFELYYQPKINFCDGAVTGVEALIRWKTAAGEAVSPDEFIPLAEQTSMIVEIGDWVIEESCRQLRRWHDLGHTSLTMAINLSARQFIDPDLTDKLLSALDRNGLAVHQLQLEITEHTMVEQIEQTVAIMNRLSNLGFSIAIDDFGTGFSSLAYLKQFPITTLKIDRSFVTDLPGDQHDCTIVRLICSLAKSLGLTIVAEGVETTEQFTFLDEQGCDTLQGYLYCKPQPAPRLEELFVSGFGVEHPRPAAAEQFRRINAT